MPRRGGRGGRRRRQVRRGRARQAARRRTGRARRLARLPRHRLGRGGRGRRPLHGEDREGRGLRLRQGLGHRRDAEPRRQFVRPARPHPRQHEAARRGRASVADAAGRGRLAEPGRRRRCSVEAQGHARASRVRQRRRPGRWNCAAGPRGSASPRASRHGAHGGQGRPGRGPRRAGRRPGLAPHRPARRQPFLRPDRRRARDRERGRTAAGMEPRARRVGRRAGRQSARRPLRQRGRLALLHRAGQGGGETGPVIPPGRCWRAGRRRRARRRSSGWPSRCRSCCIAGPPAAKESPDAALYRQLTSLGGPLFARIIASRTASGERLAAATRRRPRNGASTRRSSASIPTASRSTPRASACGRRRSSRFAPRRPGRRLRVRRDGRASTRTPARAGASSSRRSPTKPDGASLTALARPRRIVVHEGSGATEAHRGRVRRVPPALSGGAVLHEIVPVDEVVTLTLFYREDDHLARLMLDDAQQAQLDRLWDELHFVSHDALTLGRCLRAVHGVRHAGRRPEGVRAAAQADPRPRRRVPASGSSTPSRSTSTRCSTSRRAPTAGR